MQFRLLGPLDVLDGSRAVVVQRARVRALLALLLLHARRVVGAEQLVDELWGEQVPARPIGALHNYVSILRRALEPAATAGRHRILRTEPAGYVLHVPDEHIDAAVFEMLATQARGALTDRRWAAAADTCARALALWRGPALADFRDQAFAIGPSQRLEEARRSCEHDRISARLALGHHVELVGELEAAVAADPLREPLWGHLMLALYRAGRQADALGAYQTLRRTLGAELGLDPSPELQGLEEAILLQKSELDWEPPGPDQAVLHRPAPAPLPLLLTGFVGREQELADIGELLARDDVRVLTLTGPGGAGKTRLAVEAAAAHASAFPGGVCFVALAAVSDPDLVAPAIARALDLAEAGNQTPLEAVAQHLRDRRMLLLLDNFEQVRPAASVVTDLLGRAPGTTALVTSRAVLQVHAEHEYRVPPLSLPDRDAELGPGDLARSEALALFVQRAEAVGAGFTLSPENAGAVADVCARVEGLPLAIELAAARLRLLTPGELALRLVQSFDLLSGGPQDLPARQRGLRDTIDWSHALLDEDDQRLFARLSVFVGGCTVDAAEAVAGGDGPPVLDGLASLVDNSLVWREITDEGASRFRMLETIREYAREQLAARAEASAVHARHAAYYLAVAQDADEALHHGDELRALAEFDREQHNITAALEWSLSADGPDDDGQLALGLVSAMGLYWYSRGHNRIGIDWLERALGTAERAEAGLRATACFWLASLLDRRGEWTRARALMEESVSLMRASEDGDTYRVASALNGLGTIAEHEGDLAVARTVYEDALGIYRALDNAFGVGIVLIGLGAITLDEGDSGKAAALLVDSITWLERADDHWSAAMARGELARVRLDQGHLDDAERLLDEATAVLRGRGDLTYLAECLEGHACIAAARGYVERAGQLAGAADALRRRIGVRLTRGRVTAAERHLGPARARGGAAYDAAAARGAAMPLDEALDGALEHDGPAARRRGRHR